MVFHVPQPGDLFEGRLRLIEQIGSGAFAVVFRAEQVDIQREVAVKILLSHSPAFDETTLERFRREAQTLSRLHHPNSLTLYELGWTADQRPFLVTELVPGRTLRALIDTESSLRIPRAVQITRQLLYALREAHNQSIIHRDIKPTNIMVFDRVGERDVVKVLDFGIAKLVGDVLHGDDPDAIRQDLTLKGKILGTPRYMAPELLCQAAISPATDLYAVGLLLYEMVTGQEAVPGDDPIQIISAQVGPDPVIHPADPLLPDALRPILAACTQKNVHARAASAQEILSALDRLDLPALEAWRPPRASQRLAAIVPAAPYGTPDTRSTRSGLARLADIARSFVSAEPRLIPQPEPEPEPEITPTPEPAAPPLSAAASGPRFSPLTTLPFPGATAAPPAAPPAPLLERDAEDDEADGPSLDAPEQGAGLDLHLPALEGVDAGWDLDARASFISLVSLSREELEAAAAAPAALDDAEELEPVEPDAAAEDLSLDDLPPDAADAAPEVEAEEVPLPSEADELLDVDAPEPSWQEISDIIDTAELKAAAAAAAAEPEEPIVPTTLVAAPEIAAAPAAPVKAPAAPEVYVIPPPPEELRRAEPLPRGGVPTGVIGAAVALALVALLYGLVVWGGSP